ncbi:MAG: rhodanese-like domain-containing protein [Chitinophagaceae bacterium]|nr:rhodanese-like domain-containing protein [Chitinophagaceae bacterium]
MLGLFFKNKIKDAIRKGAIIIDVRPAHAFDQHGRVPGSINIPLDRISINIERIKNMNQVIVLCCEYGDHCTNAARILKENGIKNVLNGGSWRSVYRKAA